MQQDVRRRVVPLIALAFACLMTQSWAGRRVADGVNEPSVARVNVAEHLLSFEPLVPYDNLSLTIVGNGRVVFESTFEPGAAVLFDLFDQEGNPLTDGSYSYELRVAPKIAPQTRQLLDQARAEGSEKLTASRLRALGALPKGPMSMSGSFAVRNGSVVDPDLPEAGEDGTDYRLGAVAPQDIIHNDDVIITFSLCVGTDCANGENFGFDTIRLKENNLRIRAFDTSNSASFPTRDWQLTFNDSANGGADKFSIEDLDVGRVPFTLIAGAPTNSLFVASSGNVGLGTGTPTVELHIVDGDSPTLRLAQDGSSGFTPQTWDVAGNEASFFVRDATNGSTLPFRIRPGAPSSAIDIAANGNVGVGTGSPNKSLHVRRTNGTAQVFVEEASGTTANRDLLSLTNNGAPRILFTDTSSPSDVWRFQLDANRNFVIDFGPSAGAEFQITQGGGIRNNTGTNPVLIDDPQGLNVTGTLTKGSGSFKIDHPLDPANKFLYHSFVESPDMMNIYNGNALLDENGEAVVEMPDWFEALNRDFRYQLTPVGAPGPGLYVAEEIKDRQFRIAGGVAGGKVSWQVTGIRHDRFADAHRIPVEEAKPDDQRGTFLHPDLFRDVDVSQILKAEGKTQIKKTDDKKK